MQSHWLPLRNDLELSSRIMLAASMNIFGSALIGDDLAHKEEYVVNAARMSSNATFQTAIMFFMDNIHESGLIDQSIFIKAEAGDFHKPNNSEKNKNMYFSPFNFHLNTGATLGNLDKLHHYIDLLNPDEENFPQGRYKSFDAIYYLIDYAYNQYYKNSLPNIEHFSMLKTACFFQMNIKNENCLPEQEVAYNIGINNIIVPFFKSHDFSKAEKNIIFDNDNLAKNRIVNEMCEWAKILYTPEDSTKPKDNDSQLSNAEIYNLTSLTALSIGAKYQSN